MESLAIRCSGLRKSYADVVAVDGLDLEVRRGECFGLLGPNGAGKTTTVEVCEGLLDADAGTVELLGTTWAEAGRDLRRRLGVQLQQAQLMERLSVVETLRLFASFYRGGRTAEDALAMVHLEDKRDAWVKKLSGGQLQRLSLACALVGDPELLFLDEPTTGLDPQSRRRIWEVVEQFRADGGTVLLTTHYMEEADRLCGRIAIVDHGRVIALDTPAGLVASLGAEHIVELELDADAELEGFGRLDGVRAARPAGDRIALTVTEVHRTVPAVLAEIARQGRELTRLATHHATLEDVFVELTGRQLRD